MSSFHNQETVHTQAGVLNQHGDHYHAPVYMGAAPQPQPLWTSGNVHWLVPRAVSPLFTGRNVVLQRIEQNIKTSLNDKDRSESSRLVITGMGGQGKSENAATAEAGFIAVSKLLKQPAKSVDGARHLLDNIQYPWLLVLDNADDPNTDYQQYFPSSSSTFILLTSRNIECGIYENVGHEILDGLDEGDGEELLLRTSRIPQAQRMQHRPSAHLICILLASHPLALIQAGAYVSQRHCTLAQYPDVYKTHRQRLLNFRPAQAQSRYQDVYATLDVSAEYLRSSSSGEASDALQLLSIMCMLAQIAIPFAVFEAAGSFSRDYEHTASENKNFIAAFSSKLPSLLRKEAREWDSFRLTNALHQLKLLALVLDTDTDSQLTWLYMHSLTYAWARDRQDTQTQRSSWISAGCVLVLSHISEEHRLWYQHYRQLLPHIHYFLAFPNRRKYVREEQKEGTIIEMMIQCGRILKDTNKFQDLLTFSQEMFEDLDLDSRKPGTKFPQLYYQLASGYLNNGQTKDGISILKHHLRAAMESFLQDKLVQLSSRNELAEAYLQVGKLKKAVKMLEHTADLRAKFCPEDMQNLQRTRWRLAKAYRLNGQYVKAVKLLETVVRIKELEFKEDDRRTQAARHELAKAYLANGQYLKAVNLLEHVVDIDKDTLPTDHRDCLGSQCQLAFAYEVSGKITQAIKLLEYVVQKTERLPDWDDFELPSMKYHLMRWYQRLEEAAVQSSTNAVAERRHSIETSDEIGNHSSDLGDFKNIAIDDRGTKH